MTQIDIANLANLSWLSVNADDTKTTKSINDIVWYMQLMDWFVSDDNTKQIANQSNIYISNDSDRNNWTIKFDSKDQILQNSNHPKINNSVVLSFAE